METAKSFIKESWKTTRVRKPKREQVSIIAGHSILLNDKLMSVALRNYLEFYDEFISWLADLATVLLFSEPLKREDYAYAHLASALCSLALSVRHQVCVGQDVPAKILARSLAEYSDVMALLIARPDLRAEFQTEESPEKFWQNHVRGGKARRAALATMPLKGRAATWAAQYESFRKDEGKFLSSSVHPSYVSAAMTLLAAGDEEEVYWPGYLGRVTDASVRTLAYAMLCLSVIVFLQRLPFGDDKRQFSIGLTFDPKNRLHRQLEARRHVLIRILGFLGSRRSEQGVFKVKRSARLKESGL